MSDEVEGSNEVEGRAQTKSAPTAPQKTACESGLSLTEGASVTGTPQSAAIDTEIGPESATEELAPLSKLQLAPESVPAVAMTPVVQPPRAEPAVATPTSAVPEAAVARPPAIEGEGKTKTAATAEIPAHGAPTAEALPDALLRSGASTTETPRDFAGELAKLRELPAVPVHAARASAASDSAAEILRQVRVGLSADLREASIQLAPEALGRVSIRLRVEHGVLSADVRAETPQALSALQLHAPELKAALAGHGPERAPELSFSLMHDHAGDAPGRGRAPSSSPRTARRTLDIAPIQVERALARRLAASGVDTYA
ncbi:MAG TPA: flagellar hook-length control protein FliK [Planctomycetota bacterium]|nr:flagellar hook-length control protein FliK [Planctomycetota bacterium]